MKIEWSKIAFKYLSIKIIRYILPWESGFISTRTIKLDPSWIMLPKDDIWTSWPLWPLLIFRNHISNESVLCHSYSEGFTTKNAWYKSQQIWTKRQFISPRNVCWTSVVNSENGHVSTEIYIIKSERWIVIYRWIFLILIAFLGKLS